MVRVGATVQLTIPVAEAVITRAGPKVAWPAGRVATRTRASAIAVPLLVAANRSVAFWPATIACGPAVAATWSVAGSATANCHITGPATFPALSETVTAMVCTPAPRLPGA